MAPSAYLSFYFVINLMPSFYRLPLKKKNKKENTKSCHASLTTIVCRSGLAVSDVFDEL